MFAHFLQARVEDYGVSASVSAAASSDLGALVSPEILFFDESIIAKVGTLVERGCAVVLYAH
jgi:hypothetical protein